MTSHSIRRTECQIRLRDVDKSGNVRVIPCLGYGWPDNRAMPLPVTNYEYSTLLLHLTNQL